jgi:protein-S-isoprenylcysteine O-methyltransferase Ste14
LNYNKFRIWVGRILGVILLVFSQGDLNLYALLVIAIGVFIRIWATGYIHKNQEVTMAGPYKLLRHPLYLGNFIAGLGFALLANVWQLVVLFIPIFLGVYYKKMQLEEQYLRDEFGIKYNVYQATTPLFIPNLTRLFKEDNVKFSWQNVILNREHLNLSGIVIIIIFFIYQSESGLLRNALLLLTHNF